MPNNHAERGARAAILDLTQGWVIIVSREEIPAIVSVARSQAGGEPDFWAGYELELRKQVALCTEIIGD